MGFAGGGGPVTEREHRGEPKGTSVHHRGGDRRHGLRQDSTGSGRTAVCVELTPRVWPWAEHLPNHVLSPSTPPESPWLTGRFPVPTVRNKCAGGPAPGRREANLTGLKLGRRQVFLGEALGGDPPPGPSSFQRHLQALACGTVLYLKARSVPVVLPQLWSPLQPPSPSLTESCGYPGGPRSSPHIQFG